MKNKNIFKINTIYFIALLLVAIIFTLGYLGILKNDILTSFLIQIVVMFAIPLVMYSLLTRKNIKDSLKDCGLKKITGKMISISILLGFVLYFINSFVADAFYGILTMFGYESLSSQTTSTLNYTTLLKELILSCILPGFCEEFLHRGIMLHANKKHRNTKSCLLISSILFGLTHLNIRQFFYAAILGFLMGYTSLIADSIWPSIIIHFMNNFLSNYFYYGQYLNWPLAKLFNAATKFFLNNIFSFIITISIGVILLIIAYKYLLKKLLQERAKNEVKSIIKALELDQLSMYEAEEKFNQVNELLKHHALQEENNKTNFTENIFLIASFILGILITISSFIWGVI